MFTNVDVTATAKAYAEQQRTQKRRKLLNRLWATPLFIVLVVISIPLHILTMLTWNSLLCALGLILMNYTTNSTSVLLELMDIPHRCIKYLPQVICQKWVA